jgi:hypothetical protein
MVFEYYSTWRSRSDGVDRIWWSGIVDILFLDIEV